jgi:2-iminobutanoate/2-iminopropanoate deaminase
MWLHLINNEPFAHAPAKRRMRPIRRMVYQAVFDRAAVNLVQVSRKVPIIADRMLPVPSPLKLFWPDASREDDRMIKFLMVPGAPAPVAPFSHATAVDGWLFVTGQMPTDPENDSAPLPEGIEAQTRRVIENLRRVLAGAGSALDQVVFARVYLTEFERDYAAMNVVYQTYFAPGELPARTCIGVTALARGALVEIDLLARRTTD